MIVADASLATLGSTVLGGFGFAGGFVFFRWLLTFISGRHDRREAHLDAATKNLIEQLQGQIQTLLDRLDQVEKDLADCKRQHAESEHDRAQLRGLLQGYGDARQEAQRIIALDKLSKDGDKE